MYPKTIPPHLSQFLRGGCLDHAYAVSDLLTEADRPHSLVGLEIAGEVHHLLVYLEDEELFVDALGYHTETELDKFWSRSGAPVYILGISDINLDEYTEDEDRYDEAWENAQAILNVYA